MDATTRRNIGIGLALLGMLLLLLVGGYVVADTFVWADPDAPYNTSVLGGGCCCGAISGLIFAYGLLSAIAASRA